MKKWGSCERGSSGYVFYKPARLYPWKVHLAFKRATDGSGTVWIDMVAITRADKANIAGYNVITNGSLIAGQLDKAFNSEDE